MINADRIIGISSLAIAAVVFSVTRDLSQLGGVFIDYTLIAIVALALLMVAKSFVKPQKLVLFESRGERNNVIIGIIILLVYLVLMPVTGFLLASYIFYAVFNMYLGEDLFSKSNIIKSVCISAVVVTIFYVIFRFVLAVPLPRGIFFE
jgi:hypothetical protein